LSTSIALFIDASNITETKVQKLRQTISKVFCPETSWWHYNLEP